MKTNIVLLVLLAALAACHDRAPQVLALPAAADPARPGPGQMTVTGSATLEVTPDCADLTITLSAEAARPGGASRQVGDKQAALVAALTKLGVATKDLKLSTLSLDPLFEQRVTGEWTDHVRGYRAAITVVATTRDFGKIADLLEAAADSGATSMSTQFRRSDLAELKKKVRDMALTAAKDKAAQTTHALGIKLGTVVAVVESQGGTMWSQAYFPSNMVAVEGASAALGGTLQPLTLEVSVSYELPRA